MEHDDRPAAVRGVVEGGREWNDDVGTLVEEARDLVRLEAGLRRAVDHEKDALLWKGELLEYREAVAARLHRRHVRFGDDACAVRGVDRGQRLLRERRRDRKSVV